MVFAKAFALGAIAFDCFVGNQSPHKASSLPEQRALFRRTGCRIRMAERWLHRAMFISPTSLIDER